MQNRAGNKRRKDSKQHLVNPEYLGKDGGQDGMLEEQELTEDRSKRDKIGKPE